MQSEFDDSIAGLKSAGQGFPGAINYDPTDEY